MKIIFPDTVKKYVTLQMNGKFEKYSNEKIFDFMYPYIENLNPQSVLELGCGIGRASVHFFKKFNWVDTKFYLLDGNSGDKQIAQVNPNTSRDFYNSMRATQDFCIANGLTNFELINIEKEDIPDIKVDLVYSVAAIGFHWSIDLYLDKLVDKLNPGTLILIQTRVKNNEERSKWVEREIEFIKKHSKYVLVSYDRSNMDGIFVIINKQKEDL